MDRVHIRAFTSRLGGDAVELDREFAAAAAGSLVSARTRSDTSSVCDIILDAYEWRLNAGLPGPFFTKDDLLEANAALRGYRDWNTLAASMFPGPARVKQPGSHPGRHEFMRYVAEAEPYYLSWFISSFVSRYYLVDATLWQTMAMGLLEIPLQAALSLRSRLGIPFDFGALYRMLDLDQMEAACAGQPSVYDGADDVVIGKLRAYLQEHSVPGQSNREVHAYKQMHFSASLPLLGAHYATGSEKNDKSDASGSLGGRELPTRILDALPRLLKFSPRPEDVVTSQ